MDNHNNSVTISLSVQQAQRLLYIIEEHGCVDPATESKEDEGHRYDLLSVVQDSLKEA